MTSPAIKCACPTKSGNGGANGISCPCPTKSRGRPKEPHLLELDRHLVRLVEEQKPTNIRSLYYRSVSLGLGPKDEKSPNKSNDACFCLGGMALFLFHRLWNESREVYGHDAFDGPDDFAEEVVRLYRRDYWRHHDSWVVVFLEKRALKGVLSPIVVDRWGLNIYSCNGQLSESLLYRCGVDTSRIEANQHTLMC